MSDRYLGWKYWDQTGNCWQYIDLDEFYGEEDDNDHLPSFAGYDNQTETDWPNLTIVDLLDSDHLKHGKNYTPAPDGVISSLDGIVNDPHRTKSLPNRVKSKLSRIGQVRSPGGRRSLPNDDNCDSEDISKKYDIRALNSRLTDTKSTILDIPLSQISNSSRHRSCEKTWQSSLRTPLVPASERKESFISSVKNEQRINTPKNGQRMNTPVCSQGPRTHRKSSKLENEKVSIDNSSKTNPGTSWVKLVWKPRNSSQPEIEKNNQIKVGLNAVSLSDQFSGGIIHSPNPISNTKRILHACKVKNPLGYTVEPITGTGVRPPLELQNFKCEPTMDGNRRPETPVEIKRLRLLPTPVVRKCMAEALKNGILEPKDTELIMKRIKNKSTGPNSESDEEIIKNQSKRLISPLKYMRRPRPDGGPIYKLDDSKTKKTSSHKLAETDPITFKVVYKTESAVIPTHLEIPFLQKTKSKRRMRTKTWQSTLRSSAPEPPQITKKPVISFDGRNKLVETSMGSVLTRPIPPPPSPIKNLFTVIPELMRSKYSDPVFLP